MQTRLDEIANQNHLQLMKAIIPHLPPGSQKTFSVMIKMMEVRNVLNYYSRPPGQNHGLRYPFRPASQNTGSMTAGESGQDGIKTADSCLNENADEFTEESSEDSSDMLDILSDIRQYCEGEEAEMIDQALQMMSMMELYSMFSQQESRAI
ncbi:MAG: hypothetical protein LUG99_13825 [Lachnospiraceae bacterium]|nr:hypothetical protein [Lachnospiraceae bacterium]